MFTQFFGNYLLNKKIISRSQLVAALKLQEKTHLKLGVLAINAGMMTAAQVNDVHATQAKVDKRFGEIAKDKGILTAEQITLLLCSQRTGHLLLGQNLVDMKIMTTEEFETALNDYKSMNALTDSDFSNTQKDKINVAIENFYHFDSSSFSKYFTSYATLLFKNIVRFIGDDFTPLDVKILNSYKGNHTAVQKMKGTVDFFTAIDCDNDAVINFAARYSEEEVTQNDDYTQACVSEFLNLHNGLFTVNVSNDYQVELELTPPAFDVDKVFTYSNKLFDLPICFSFGTIHFLVSANKAL